MITSLAGAGSKSAQLYKQGRQAEKNGDVVRAYLLYAQAAALEPTNQLYWLRSESLRTLAARKTRVLPPPSETSTQAASEPEGKLPDVGGMVTPQMLEEAKEPLPPIDLKGTAGKKNFDLTGDSKALWEQMAKAWGLDVVFDGEYQPAPQTRFHMDEIDYRTALHSLETVTGSFVIPLSERVFLVAQDTQAKRRSASPTATVVIPVPEPVSAQEAAELTQAVRQTMDSQKFFLDSQHRVVVLRDEVGKVRVAQELFEQLLHQRPEVEVELEFVEINRSSSLQYGIQVPTQAIISYLGGWKGSPPFYSIFTKFLKFGGGYTTFGIGVMDLLMVATLTRSDASNIFRAVIRSSDGQPATLHVGTKYPIQSQAYIGTVTGTGQVYSPPPTFTFEDLGILLKVTPHVHGMDDVSMEVDAEFKLLTGQSLNGIPVISSRKIEGDVRVKDGEWGVLTGLMTASQAKTLSGLAGVSTIPYLGALFSENSRDNQESQLLIVIKPHILSLPPSENVSRKIPVGSETRPQISL